MVDRRPVQSIQPSGSKSAQLIPHFGVETHLDLCLGQCSVSDPYCGFLSVNYLIHYGEPWLSLSTKEFFGNFRQGKSWRRRQRKTKFPSIILYSMCHLMNIINFACFCEWKAKHKLSCYYPKKKNKAQAHLL